MMSKEERLKECLTGAEVVTIEIINTHIVDGKSAGERIHLISGIPENDLIISKLRNALCK